MSVTPDDSLIDPYDDGSNDQQNRFVSNDVPTYTVGK